MQTLGIDTTVNWIYKETYVTIEDELVFFGYSGRLYSALSRI